MTRNPQIKNNKVLKINAVSSGELDAEASFVRKSEIVHKNRNIKKFFVFLTIFITSVL